MIKIYYRKGCGSSKRAISWFDKYDIDVHKQHINTLTKRELFKILKLSAGGLEEVLKHPNKSNSEIKEKMDHLEELHLEEAMEYIISNNNVLQSPIILDDHNHLSGYNEDEIRKFLPKEYRRHQLNKE